MWEYQKIEMFLQKVTLQIGPRKSLELKKLRILCGGNMLLMILTGKKLSEFFMKKNSKKQEFRIWKVIKRKGDKLYVKWKG